MESTALTGMAVPGADLIRNMLLPSRAVILCANRTAFVKRVLIWVRAQVQSATFHRAEALTYRALTSSVACAALGASVEKLITAPVSARLGMLTDVLIPASLRAKASPLPVFTFHEPVYEVLAAALAGTAVRFEPRSVSACERAKAAALRFRRWIDTKRSAAFFTRLFNARRFWIRATVAPTVALGSLVLRERPSAVFARGAQRFQAVRSFAGPRTKQAITLASLYGGRAEVETVSTLRTRSMFARLFTKAIRATTATGFLLRPESAEEVPATGAGYGDGEGRLKTWHGPILLPAFPRMVPAIAGAFC